VARDLSEVIGQLLSVIPESEVELRADLVKIQCTTLYTAPEIMADRWHQAQTVLQDALGSREDQWVADCASIFGGHDVRPQAAKATEQSEPLANSDEIEF
jgi:hypothetical protein